jgi:hypothetical protein
MDNSARRDKVLYFRSAEERGRHQSHLLAKAAAPRNDVAGPR